MRNSSTDPQPGFLPRESSSKEREAVHSETFSTCSFKLQVLVSGFASDFGLQFILVPCRGGGVLLLRCVELFGIATDTTTTTFGILKLIQNVAFT